MSNREDVLRKLKALAERGVGGEAVNAEKLLKRMMEKYGITEEEIQDDRRTRQGLRYHGAFGKELMHQIIFMVMGDGVTLYRYKGGTKEVIIDCTKAEQIEIKAAFEFYRRMLDNGLRKYYDAFVQVEYLFPPDIEIREGVEIDPEMLALARGMQKHERLLEIEGGT